MRKREFMKRLKSALDNANRRVRVLNDGSKYGAGLASEGYDAGYLNALRDVEAVLTHGYPADDRSVWCE